MILLSEFPQQRKLLILNSGGLIFSLGPLFPNFAYVNKSNAYQYIVFWVKLSGKKLGILLLFGFMCWHKLLINLRSYQNLLAII